jgi:hypothetical protein
MAFPEIKHCLICDAVRAEALGKLTMLGFYGVTPDVQINIKDFQQPLQVAFVLVGGIGEGRATVAFQFADARGQVLLATPVAESGPIEPGKRLLTGVGLSYVFPGPGRYFFRVLVDGRMHYQTSFELLQGAPADFTF